MGIPAVRKRTRYGRMGNVIAWRAAPQGVGNAELIAFEPGPSNAIIQDAPGRSHEGSTDTGFLCAKRFPNEEDTSGALPIECHESLPRTL
jgi:hypothetical protein